MTNSSRRRSCSTFAARLLLAVVQLAPAISLWADDSPAVLTKFGKRRAAIHSLEIKVDSVKTIFQGSSNLTMDLTEPGKRQGIDVPATDLTIPIQRTYRVDFARNWWFDSVRGTVLMKVDQPPFYKTLNDHEDYLYDGTQYVVVKPEAKNRPVGKESSAERQMFLDVEITTAAGGAGDRRLAGREFIVLIAAGRIPPQGNSLRLSDLADAEEYPPLVTGVGGEIEGEDCSCLATVPEPGQTFFSEYWFDAAGRVRRLRQAHGATLFMQLDVTYADATPLANPQSYVLSEYWQGTAVRRETASLSVVTNPAFTVDQFRYTPRKNEIIELTDGQKTTYHLEGKKGIVATDPWQFWELMNAKPGWSIWMYIIAAQIPVMVLIILTFRLRRRRQLRRS